jgi:hypothetical protein
MLQNYSQRDPEGAGVGIGSQAIVPVPTMRRFLRRGEAAGLNDAQLKNFLSARFYNGTGMQGSPEMFRWAGQQGGDTFNQLAQYAASVNPKSGTYDPSVQHQGNDPAFLTAQYLKQTHPNGPLLTNEVTGQQVPASQITDFAQYSTQDTAIAQAYQSGGWDAVARDPYGASLYGSMVPGAVHTPDHQGGGWTLPQSAGGYGIDYQAPGAIGAPGGGWTQAPGATGFGSPYMGQPLDTPLLPNNPNGPQSSAPAPNAPAGSQGPVPGQNPSQTPQAGNTTPESAAAAGRTPEKHAAFWSAQGWHQNQATGVWHGPNNATWDPQTAQQPGGQPGVPQPGQPNHQQPGQTPPIVPGQTVPTPTGGGAQPTGQPAVPGQYPMPSQANPGLPLDTTYEAQRRMAENSLQSQLAPLGPQGESIASQLQLAEARQATNKMYDTQQMKETLNGRGMLNSSLLGDESTKLATDYLRQNQDLGAQSAQAYGNLAQAAAGAYGDYYQQMAEYMLQLQQRTEQSAYAPVTHVASQTQIHPKWQPTWKPSWQPPKRRNGR